MTVDISLQRNAWLDGFFREITCTDDGVPKINHKIICIIKYRLEVTQSIAVFSRFKGTAQVIFR